MLTLASALLVPIIVSVTTHMALEHIVSSRFMVAAFGVSFNRCALGCA
jgi:hypothetical protein